MSLGDASDLLMSVSSALTCCLEMTSSELSDTCCASPIVGRCQNPPLPPELVDGKEEYVVEKILTSRMFQRKLQYLVKWEGYGIEENTWEYSENLNHVPEKVTEFHTKNLGAPCRIRALAFGLIPFRPISLSSASSRCSSRGGVIVRGTPSASASRSPSARTPGSPLAPTTPNLPSLLTCLPLVLRWRAT